MSRIKSQHPGLSVPQGPPLTTVPCMGLMPLPQPHGTSLILNPHPSSHSAPLLWLFPLQRCRLPPTARPAMAITHKSSSSAPVSHSLEYSLASPGQPDVFSSVFPITLFTALRQPSNMPHSISCGHSVSGAMSFPLLYPHGAVCCPAQQPW